MMIAIRVLFAIVFSGAFSVLFHIKKKYLVCASLSGGIGYCVYLLVLMAANTVIAAFLAGLSISIYSEIMARVKKAPAIMFLCPGLLTIVPGGGVFLLTLYAIEGELGLVMRQGYYTFMEAGAIALSIIAVTTVTKIIFPKPNLTRANWDNTFS